MCQECVNPGSLKCVRIPFGLPHTGVAPKTAARRTASVTTFTSVFEITYRILEYVLEMTFFNSQYMLDFEETEIQANNILNFLLHFFLTSVSILEFIKL